MSSGLGSWWGARGHPSPAWELGESVPSTATLQKKKASGMSVEEQDEVPASIRSHGEDSGGPSSAEPL